MELAVSICFPGLAVIIGLFIILFNDYKEYKKGIKKLGKKCNIIDYFFSD